MPLIGTILRMANRGGSVKDDFNRTLSGSLGSTSLGGLPWSVITGTWSVNGTKPTTATTQSSNPLATINPGTPNQTALLTLGAGDALYFRVQNATNWWRALWEGYQTSSCGTCCNTCCSTCCSTCSGNEMGCSNPGYTGGNNCKGCMAGNSPCLDSCCRAINTQWVCNYTGNTCTASCYCSSCNCYSCNCYSCNCSYYDNYRLRLEKMVAGALTAVSVGSVQSTPTTRAKIVTSADGQVSAYFGSTGQTALYSGTDAALASQTLVGIGRGASSYNTSAIDDFDLTA